MRRAGIPGRGQSGYGRRMATGCAWAVARGSGDERRAARSRRPPVRRRHLVQGRRTADRQPGVRSAARPSTCREYRARRAACGRLGRPEARAALDEATGLRAIRLSRQGRAHRLRRGARHLRLGERDRPAPRTGRLPARTDSRVGRNRAPPRSSADGVPGRRNLQEASRRGARGIRRLRICGMGRPGIGLGLRIRARSGSPACG